MNGLIVYLTVHFTFGIAAFIVSRVFDQMGIFTAYAFGVSVTTALLTYLALKNGWIVKRDAREVEKP